MSCDGSFGILEGRGEGVLGLGKFERKTGMEFKTWKNLKGQGNERKLQLGKLGKRRVQGRKRNEESA